MDKGAMNMDTRLITTLLMCPLFIGIALLGSGCRRSSTGGGFSLAKTTPPTLTGYGASSTEVYLEWTDETEKESGFDVERSDDNGGTYKVVATVAADETSCKDNVPEAETEYLYRVRAFDAKNASDYSNSVTAFTLFAPSDLEGRAGSSSRIDLQWTDNSDMENGYSLERNTGRMEFEVIADLAADTTSYQDENLDPETLYFYRLRAYNENGSMSDYSDVIGGETALTPWAKAYCGLNDDSAVSVLDQGDQGFVAAGTTSSFGAGPSDCWVLKVARDGAVEWEKTYGGAYDDYGKTIIESVQGGLILAANTTAFGAGASDAWILNLDQAGNIVWEKAYGGPSYDFAAFTCKSSNGGYIVVGATASFGAGSTDAWVLKLDSNGDVEWQKRYGDYNEDYALSAATTDDGGCVLAGTTSSFGAGAGDFWILKLSAAGDVEWQKSYGSTYEEYARSIAQTPDSGFIVAGDTYCSGTSYPDVWVLKLDLNGDVEWQKAFGGTGATDFEDYGRFISVDGNGGIILAADTCSFGEGDRDLWLVKLSPEGVLEWEKSYAGSGDDLAGAAKECINSGYCVTGTTAALSLEDVWLFKVDPDGSISFNPSGNVTVHNTQCTVSDTYAVPKETFVTPVDTSVNIEDTQATVTVSKCTVVNQTP